MKTFGLDLRLYLLVTTLLFILTCHRCLSYSRICLSRLSILCWSSLQNVLKNNMPILSLSLSIYIYIRIILAWIYGFFQNPSNWVNPNLFLDLITGWSRQIPRIYIIIKINTQTFEVIEFLVNLWITCTCFW